MQIDWISVLFFVFFIVLPLLQQLTQKRKPPLDAPEDEAEWELPEHTSRGEVRRDRDAAEWEDEWSNGEEGEVTREQNAWEALDLEDLFRETPPEPRPEPGPAPAPRPEPLPTPRSEPRVQLPERPLPAPVPPPRAEPVVVSLEALEIDRAAEHRRFHDAYVRSTPPARVEPRRPVAVGFRSPRELRRALVLSEVLGPPRSLRDIEDRG